MQWVSVNEKLPKERERIIAVHGSCYILICSFFNKSFWTYNGGKDDCYYGITGITHWMPLPELPTASNNVINPTS